MHIGIATDIYGAGEGIRQLTSDLRSRGAAVSIISPYETDSVPGCRDVKEVYAAFIEECGHEHYREKILRVLQKEGCDAVIGFSAGASSMWRVLAGSSLKSLHHFLGFYPTRIRDYLEYFPQTPTTLIFPCFEKVVDVDMLIQKIAGRGDTCCRKVPYLHGFLNPLSENFSIDGAGVFAEILGTPEILCSPSECRQALAKVP